MDHAPPYRSLLATRSMEWWLARGGAVLTSLALILLYQYAVERNWITPIVRVAAGLSVGGALFYFASRIDRSSPESADDTIGLREVLLGAGLAAWYITAYAAAIFYGLIPLSAARFAFLLLSVTGAWIALSEHRSVLGFLALSMGFLTPVLLPSSVLFVPVLALYLGAMTALGVVLYLMRGWQSVFWLTAAGFWVTAAGVVGRFAPGSRGTTIVGSLLSARFSMTVLIVAAGAALVRTPILRRRLVSSGSPLYTASRRSPLSASIQEALAERVARFSGVIAGFDSPALWVITIGSPLLMVLLLSWTWTAVQGSVWGVASLALAMIAYRLASSGSDAEFDHVEATAAVVWSLAGVLWLADSIGAAIGESSALMLLAVALHAFLTLRYLLRSRFAAPQKVALAAAAFCIVVVILSETLFRNFALKDFDMAWTVAELTVALVCVWIWWTRRQADGPARVPTFFGIGAYVSLLFIDARILGGIWPPLITASFAVAGVAFLIYARRTRGSRTLRRLGGFTLLLVFARLFVIDLDRVETIWRVLLFLGCGALFLLASHRSQIPANPGEPVA